MVGDNTSLVERGEKEAKVGDEEIDVDHMVRAGRWENEAHM